MTAEPHADAYNIHDARRTCRASSTASNTAKRSSSAGRGSLAGQLRLADDWDSPAVNDEIARDFGVAPP